ncbi:N-acetyl sugar amidotransferase [Candidatus Omnitrophota bacterium]
MEHRMCKRCVMDTTDPDIEFDDNGVCNHCHKYDQRIEQLIHSGQEGLQKLDSIVAEIKAKGKNRRYDCVIGVSGGVDSTYTAYKVKEYGLRPLAVHLDNGWDSELAVKNIENICNKLEIDLHTCVLDWEEFKDLQLAFLKSSTPDSEIPSDHAIWAAMWQSARMHKVEYLISGCNARTESHLPKAWSQGYYDWTYISNIYKQFGTGTLRTFPHVNFLQWHYCKRVIKRIDILNYLDYSKTKAMPVIEKEIGWKYYGGKHYESIYTRFFQGYILPTKFGFDKRRNHLSSLICSGEITREEALEELKEETYPTDLQKEDLAYVIKKFGITEDEFDRIMNLPLKQYRDYPTYEDFYLTRLYKICQAIVIVLRKLRGKINSAIIIVE